MACVPFLLPSGLCACQALGLEAMFHHRTTGETEAGQCNDELVKNEHAILPDDECHCPHGPSELSTVRNTTAVPVTLVDYGFLTIDVTPFPMSHWNVVSFVTDQVPYQIDAISLDRVLVFCSFVI